MAGRGQTQTFCSADLAEQNVHSLRENPNNLAMELNEITYALRANIEIPDPDLNDK
jgi:hypothetical protein